MASRSHVDMRATSEVVERRLRPIYDCLDNGNNKKAIQEADKVLKKQKDLQCAKVLKALALLRLGRHDDSSIILHEVHEQHPTEEATLQAMGICYREIHKLELIADMYENAYKSRPDNEEILTALFMAYVRLGDHKKQQQIAMLLHKLKPQKNPYYFWAVMSIVMQAHNCTEKSLSQKMFLPLAERMTKKFVDEGKLEAEAEVQMYLIILELLEKWEEALKVVEGSLGEKLVSELNFQQTKAAEYYAKLGKWAQTGATYRKLLSRNPDHILWWREYISSMIKLSASDWEPEKQKNNGIVDQTPEAVLALIKSVQETEPKKRNRGPYLAHLELIKQWQEHSGSTCRKYGEPVELFENYFDMFGTKNCCFKDMKYYLSILTEEEATKLADILHSKCNLNTEDGTVIYAGNPKQMQQHITVLQMDRCLGCYNKMSKEEKITLAHELVLRHREGLAHGTDLLQTDIQYSDNYLLLAVTLMMDIWLSKEDETLIWQIIVLLELGLKSSPSNFQMKLLLIRLYCTMGAFGPCPILYDGMEIKHIMNDTLGHIVSNHVGRLGHFMSACAMYGTMLRFFTVNHKETAEYLIASYKYGSFTKIHEFVKFRDRLQNSLQYASATAERMLLDLVLETNSHLSTEQMVMYMEIDPAKDKTIFEELCDNRDFTVMFNWEPKSWSMEKMQQHSFKEEVAWLKIRNITLRILAASVMLGHEIDHDHQTNNGVNNDGRRPIHDVLQDLQTQLTHHVQIDCQCYTQEFKYPIQGPYKTRTSTYLQGQFFPMFLAMLENVNYIHSLQDIGIEKIDNDKEVKLKLAVPSLGEDLLNKHRCSLLQEKNGQKSINPCVLENLVLFAETIAHICVLIGVCFRMLKPVKTVLARRNKKKKGNIIPMPCTFDNYNSLVERLEKVCQELHMAISDLDPVMLSLDLSTLAEPFSDEKEYTEMEKEVWQKIEKSNQQSVVEVTEFLHKKMQYLSSLHL